MKLKYLTISDNPQHPGWLKNKASLDKHGWDYQHIEARFEFGFQLKVIRDWVNSYQGDATHICYNDCFDTVAFAGMDEVVSKFDNIGFFDDSDLKMLISCEKNCYPLIDKHGVDSPNRAALYPESKTPWKYVNGGGWIAEIQFLKELFQRMPPTYNDQVWLMDAFLENQSEIKLDHNCEIFQSIAFSNQDEWEQTLGPKAYFGQPDYRILNKGTWTRPVFFHGNGHTTMDWVWEAAK